VLLPGYCLGVTTIYILFVPMLSNCLEANTIYSCVLLSVYCLLVISIYNLYAVIHLLFASNQYLQFVRS
jgi:hypothetical protein